MPIHFNDSKYHNIIKQQKCAISHKICLTNHTGYVSHHIMPADTDTQIYVVYLYMNTCTYVHSNENIYNAVYLLVKLNSDSNCCCDSSLAITNTLACIHNYI